MSSSFLQWPIVLVWFPVSTADLGYALYANLLVSFGDIEQSIKLFLTVKFCKKGQK